MTERSDRLTSIAETIKDYRAGEIDEPSPEHVDRWVNQFDDDVQLPILTELDYVLKRTYINRERVLRFLQNVIGTKNLVGADKCSFWRAANFLDIQGGGNSQREMLSLFESLLFNDCGLRFADCGEKDETFIYLDDASFTGNRIRNDIASWVERDAPQRATLHIVTMAFHRSGQYYAKREINKTAKVASKAIKVQWWRAFEIEDKKSEVNTSDVLRPTRLPEIEEVKAYADGLKYPIVLRKPGNRGEHEFFSSDEGRQVLEQELLTAGVSIRERCPYLHEYQRPLGNMVLDSLGFGSTLVTFRNCPNNTPLAFWVDDPWYPLFSRKIN